MSTLVWEVCDRWKLFKVTIKSSSVFLQLETLVSPFNWKPLLCLSPGTMFAADAGDRGGKKYPYLPLLPASLRNKTEVKISKWAGVLMSVVLWAFLFLVCKYLDAPSDSLVAMVTCEPASPST